MTHARRVLIIFGALLALAVTGSRASAGRTADATDTGANRGQGLFARDASTVARVSAARTATDAADGAQARARLQAMLEDLDRRTAEIEASGDPEAVAEAARARSAYATAIKGLGSLSDAQVAQLEARLPIVRAWPNLVNAATAGAGAAGAPASPASSNTADASAGDASAQAPAPASLTQDDYARLDQLRQDWEGVFDRYASWAPIVGSNEAEYTAWVADGRSALANLTYEDLAALEQNTAYFPDWQEAYAPDIAAILDPPGGSFATWRSADSAPVGGPSSTTPGSTKMPEAAPAASGGAAPEGSLTYPYRGAIDAGAQCGAHALNLSVDEVIARQIAEAVLRGVGLLIKFGVDVAPKDIKIEVFGASVDIPNPYTFLLQIGKLVVNGVANGLATDVAVAGVCQSTVHWQLTRIHSQSFVDRSQDQLAQIVTHNNDMTTSLNALDKKERELWKLQLQLSVEANLLEDAPSADGSDENRIALFQWLETVCYDPEELLPTPGPALVVPVPPTPVYPINAASRNNPLPTAAPFVGPPDPQEQCGLDLVRRVVVETIQHNQIAANNIHNALAYLAAGDALKANQQYASAYVRYRLAYQAAVKPDPEPTY